jgi:hypothetical protein
VEYGTQSCIQSAELDTQAKDRLAPSVEIWRSEKYSGPVIFFDGLEKGALSKAREPLGMGGGGIIGM